MSSFVRTFLLSTGALLVAGTIGLAPGTAHAFLGDCAQPVNDTPNPLASDCLFILQAAVGAQECDDPCICAASGALPILSTDALICLLATVGGGEPNCPCGGRIDLQDDDFAFDPATDVVDAALRPLFTATNYIGAFPQDGTVANDEWTRNWTVGLHKNLTVWEPASAGTLSGGVPSADGSCPAGTTDIGDYLMPSPFSGDMDICELAARYTTDVTLTNDNVYRLNTGGGQGTFVGDGDAAGKTAVGGADPAIEPTLTVEPGTLILGNTSEALVITRGANIDVNGTEADPVVMGSVSWFENWNGDTPVADFPEGSSGRGEWGGLVITGFATANQCNNLTTCDALVEGFLTPFAYGGFGEDDDSSGEIDYLIVRHAGFDIDGMGNELNGITLYTLGYNTHISHVQVHKNDDDGIEFFGGSVVIDHAVVTGVGDDNLDSDLGFTGGAQFALIKQFDDDGDNGFEMDSSSTPSDLPFSAPTYVNVTTLGTDQRSGASGIALRSTTGGYLWNGIQIGSGEACIRNSDASIATRAGVLSDPDDGILQIHNYVINCGRDYRNDSGDDTEVQDWFLADPNNVVDDPRLGETGFPSSPDLFGPEYLFDPSTDLVDANLEARFEASDYIGAFDQALEPGEGDWTLGWTVSLHKNDTVWEPAVGGTLAGADPVADSVCPAGTTDIGDYAMPVPFMGSMDICELAARYTTDITLTNDNIYRLNTGGAQGTFIGDGDAAGKTPVGGADPAVEPTLTVEPGTLILGDTSEALVVTRGANIDINGTAIDPVVMGSVTWFENWNGDIVVPGVTPGQSGRGEWGGFVVTGFATANQCNNLTTCDALVEGFLTPFSYGGFDNDDDNSGEIDYLIVRHAGFDIDGMGNELNGITLYTLGYTTRISHVQVHKNDDDGIEFFGGSVVVDHALVTGVGDDNLDSDLGFTGGAQFVLINQFTDDGDNGFEADSSSTPSDDPFSAPTYANVTVKSQPQRTGASGLALRSTTGGYWWNGIIECSGEACIRNSDDSIGTRAASLNDPDDGILQIHNYRIACPRDYRNDSGADSDVEDWFLADGNNEVLDTNLNESGYPSPPNP